MFFHSGINKMKHGTILCQQLQHRLRLCYGKWHCLQSVQNAAARLIFGIRHSKHITDTLISLRWLRVRGASCSRFSVTTCRAVNGSAPAYLSSYFTRVTDVPSRQRLRSTSTNQLAVPPFNLSTIGKRAFPVSGANFWNSLPPHVTSAPSLAIFRQRLKTFLFHLSYPDLVIWFAALLYSPVALAITFVI